MLKNPERTPNQPRRKVHPSAKASDSNLGSSRGRERRPSSGVRRKPITREMSGARMSFPGKSLPGDDYG